MLNKDGLHGATPLIYAILYGRYDACVLLLDMHADMYKWCDYYDLPVNALKLSAAEGHNDICELLLDRGIYVDIAYNDSITALYWAVDQNQLDTIKLLLKRGANPNICKYSLLECAIRVGGSIEICELLIDYGADIDVDTPLSIACEECRDDIIKLLVSKGANIEQCRLLYNIALYRMRSLA